MAEYDDLRKTLKELVFDRFSPKPSFTRGILGDGQGNVTVPERPDKSYVRFNRGANEFFEVFNRTVNPVEGWPVLIGELPWQPGLTQVVDTDWAAFEQSGWGDNIGATSPHAPTHEWPDGSPGSDVVNVYRRAIVPLRTYANNTGTVVYTNAYEYEYQGSGHVWGGVPGIDLSPVISSMPSGTMRFMGVYLDPATNLLGIVTGATTVFTSAFDPPRVQFPIGVLPTARVRVYGSQANVTEFDMRDARQPFSYYPTGTAGSGNVWPLPDEANIGATRYDVIDNFFDALVTGTNGIIGNWIAITDLSGGHATIPTGADLKGSGVDVTVLTSADSNGTIEVEGESLVEQLTVTNTDTSDGLCITAAGGGRYDTVKCICESASGYNQGWYLYGDAELINCEAYCAGGGTNDYAVWVYNTGSNPTVTIRGGYFDGDVVADQSGTTIELKGPTITGNVTEQNSGVITGHYYDANGVMHRGSDQAIVYSMDLISPANDIYRTAAASADFVATIATLPGGATLTYNAPSAGDGSTLVPVATTQIGKLVLANTTRGNDALISNCNTGTSTITLTAAVPGTWQVGDTITARSQTNTSVFSGNYYHDIEIVSDIDITSPYIFIYVNFQDTGGYAVFSLHPYEANDSQKRINFECQVANQYIGATTLLPIDLTTRRFCVYWDPTGANTFYFTLRVQAEARYIR